MTRPAHGFFPVDFGRHARERFKERFPGLEPLDCYHRAVEVDRLPLGERRLLDEESDCLFCVMPDRRVAGRWFVRTVIPASERVVWDRGRRLS
jgi:hypothetical protein